MAKRALETLGGELLEMPGGDEFEDTPAHPEGSVVAASQASTQDDLVMLAAVIEEAKAKSGDPLRAHENQARLDAGLPVPRRPYRVSCVNNANMTPLTVVAVDESEAIQRALVRWGVTGTAVSTLNYRVDLAP